ncbi:MAG: hypothetical protein GX651_05905 [Methanomicrobiales archaeon]|nr:hypothetical protein [Methanomicrobiales archaeon]
MLGRQERTALCLLLAVTVAVTAGHIILTVIGKEPFARPFTNTSADGELVFFEGIIDEVTTTRSGGHVNLRIQDTPVFIPAQVARGIPLTRGEKIFLYGIVETYRGEKEIVVNSAGDIRIG